MTNFLEKTYGRSTAINSARCIPAPAGCGKLLLDTDFAKSGEVEGVFRDPLSAKEYTISGLCQDCQDSVFGTDDEPEESYDEHFDSVDYDDYLADRQENMDR